MRRWIRVLMMGLGVLPLVAATGGCDVTQQILDTIGLAGNIANIWVK